MSDMAYGQTRTLLMMSANTRDEAADILEGIAALLRKEIDGYNGLPPGDHCIIAQLYADGAVTTVDVTSFTGEVGIRTLGQVDRATWDIHMQRSRGAIFR